MNWDRYIAALSVVVHFMMEFGVVLRFGVPVLFVAVLASMSAAPRRRPLVIAVVGAGIYVLTAGGYAAWRVRDGMGPGHVSSDGAAAVTRAAPLVATVGLIGGCMILAGVLIGRGRSD